MRALILLLGGLLGVPALAQPPPAPASAPSSAPSSALVLLGPQGGDIPTLGDELEQALAGSGHTAQRPALAMDELMLAVGCQSITVDCLQRIGQNLGAAQILLAQLDRGSLTLRLLDVSSGGDAGHTKTVLPAAAAQRARALRQAVDALFNPAPADQPTPTGDLRITATRPRVEVLIDGQARGATPLTIRGLPAGDYTVEARSSNHDIWRDRVTVKPGKLTQLEIEARGPLVEDRPSPGYLQSIRLPTWLVAGLGAACLVGATAFGAHMITEQNELDSMRGDTFQEIDRMEQLKQSGERDALVANVLFGVGGAALLGAAVLSYFDYRSSRSETHRSTSALRIGPASAAVTVQF